MIKLNVSLISPGNAMGKYGIKAKGFLLAVLRWGDGRAPLDGWSPIAYVPIDPAGNGEFFFPGRRAIPREATHLWAHCVTPDLSRAEDVSVPIPENYLPDPEETPGAAHFSVLTDLHLSAKPWTIKRALRAAESKTILLLGDSTNDGLPEQFSQFQSCIAETVPDSIVLCVPGNHDITHPKLLPAGADGEANYAFFQNALLTEAEKKGLPISFDPDSLAFSARLGRLDLIGLQCVTSGRRFSFPEGKQVTWLEKHLEEQKDAAWHIVMCHAPLLAHNPNRNNGTPYLDQNKKLQELLNRIGNIVFLSGHTHVSPNIEAGCGEFDRKTDNIYLDCGSVVATDTGGEQGLLSPDWKDGCITELAVSDQEVEICMRSIASGVKFPRGYYRFRRENEVWQRSH